MKVITSDLRDIDGDIYLVPLADLHIGDPQHLRSIVEKWTKKILETPGYYCILGGDLMDTATRTSVGDVYSSTLTPMQQLQECVRLFKPLADAGKILAVTTGNHEERISRQEGVDMTRLMCEQLGISDRYCETSLLLFIRVSSSGEGCEKADCSYTVYINHGNGGGKRPGGKINSLEDYAKIVDADCYIVGHTHMPAAFRLDFFRPSSRYGMAIQSEKVFINTASSLGYGGYGDRKGYSPASNQYPVVHFFRPQRLDMMRRRRTGRDPRHIEVTL